MLSATNTKTVTLSLLVGILLGQQFSAPNARANESNHSTSLYQHSLKRLDAAGNQNLAQLAPLNTNTASIAVVFQPDCNWCEKQIEDLAAIKRQCPQNLSTVLIGANGNQRALKRELKRFEGDFPALLADKQFVRQLGGVKGTPVTLFFGENGELVAQKRGYMQNKMLHKAVSIQSNGQCNLE